MYLVPKLDLLKGDFTDLDKASTSGGLFFSDAESEHIDSSPNGRSVCGSW